MRVIVTGWKRGIGFKIAELLEQRGDRVHRFQGDVTSSNDWELAPDTDALVNCAAIMSTCDVVNESYFNFMHVLNTNLLGPWLGMKYMIPKFQAQGHGNIVNITSINADDAGVGQATAYHASKAALSMLTRNAAVRYGKYGIRINEIRPGFTDTRMTEDYRLSAKYKEYVDRGTPLARMAHTSEIAKAVLFLLSDDASFITGASLAVDGGWTA